MEKTTEKSKRTDKRIRAKWFLYLFLIIGLPIIFVHLAETDRKQKAHDAARDQQYLEQQREDSLRRELLRTERQSLIDPRDPTAPSPFSVQTPDRDLDYYDNNYDDYRDDPSDALTYPDEIFDAYSD